MIPSSQNVVRYGHAWTAGADSLAIEFAMIGMDHLRQAAGTTLFDHYRAAQVLLWPDDAHHRWSDMILRSFCDEEITVLLGAGDTGKTYGMSKFILVDYWVFPEQTLWLVSSTEYRGAELRVWGKIKELFNRAKRLYPWLAGNPLDYMHAITTESIDDDRSLARSLQKGLILVPMKRGGANVGLSAFVGVKSPRLRHAGDEIQHCPAGFLDAYANWYGKENFKGIMAGNPLDPSDPLCTAGEPLDGWDNFVDTKKTQSWRSKFFQAHVIALDGRDSPNFDYPESKRQKFPYLIGPKKMKAVEETFGKESWQWYNQCVGKPNKGMVFWRVITRQLCEQHHALEDVMWLDNTFTSVYGLDPNYGGEDRCVGGKIDFGLNVDKRQILYVHPPEVIPVKAGVAVEPEEQIAKYVKNHMEQLGIPPKQCFYDPGGKGTLGFAFARVFGANSPIPVDFGAKPTDRPVRFDLFVEEGEPGHTRRRLKRCDEHYSKFVTELWFSVRELIEADQMRGLPLNVMQEGCLRIYRVVTGNRIEVEPKSGTPTRPGMKERVGFSPDLFDWCFEGQTQIDVPGGTQRLDEIQPGDSVLTPFGITRVASVRIRPATELVQATFSNGARLRGLGEHKIFTWDSGWVPLDTLAIDNECETVDNLPVWQILNALFTRDESTSFKALVDIIKQATTGRIRARDFFTESSGLNIAGLFLKGCASITKMATGAIMESRILSWFQSVNMPDSTCLRDWLIPLRKSTGCATTPMRYGKLRNGTDPQPARRGTVRIHSTGGNRENPSLADVSFADNHSCLHFHQEQNSVRNPAPTNTASRKPQTILGFVVSVAKCLWRTSIGRRGPVLRDAGHLKLQKPVNVFNLTLENHNVYYANGILVQNCAICVEGARRLGFQIERLGSHLTNDDEPFNWLEEWKRTHEKLVHSKELARR